MAPPCSTMPPISWTSKWRIFMRRRATSRTSAKVSSSRSSRSSPSRARSRRRSACSRSSSSSSSSSSGSQALIASTRLEYRLNCLASPMRRARSRSVMAPRIEADYLAVLDRWEGSRGVRGGRRDLCRGARLAALAALVAVALDLPGELLCDEVDRVLDVAGGLRRAQGDALQVQRRLGDAALRVGGVLLGRELHLEHRELRHLLADLLEPLLHAFAQFVGDLKVPSLDLDLHGTPLCRRGLGLDRRSDERQVGAGGSTIRNGCRRSSCELPRPDAVRARRGGGRPPSDRRCA